MMQLKHLLVAGITAFVWVQSATAEPTIFIVRHAEKADAAQSKDPDLSEAGRARAQSLAGVLKDAGITSVYATEYKRTQQTAEPFARLAHVDVTIIPAAETQALIAKLRDTKSNTLVVAHSNTIPELVKALGVTAPVAISEADYDDLFVVVNGTSPQLLRLHLPACAPISK
jgi:broad specificity phosphatase PhoE